MKIRAIITGTTGMVGEGVLKECLLHPDVEKVLAVNRRSNGIVHPKLTEIIHEDFFDLAPVEDQLVGYNACFFCLGVSSVGMSKEKYYQTTYVLTMHFAETLARLNNDMTFCYISGAGTDSTEKGKLSWARVKGKTENDLLKLPFKNVYNFRPGFLHPSRDLKNIHGFNAMYTLLNPLLRTFFPGFVSSLKQLGLAMINAVRFGYNKPVLEVKDINSLSER